MSDIYDVLPLPTHLGAIRDKESNLLKPFVAVYFPDEILNKMKWSRETRLILSVEKGFLKIEKVEDDRETFFFETNELTYEPFDDI